MSSSTPVIQFKNIFLSTSYIPFMNLKVHVIASILNNSVCNHNLNVEFLNHLSGTSLHALNQLYIYDLERSNPYAVTDN